MAKSPTEERLYGHHWRKIRRQVLARDGGVCQIDGPGCTGKATHVDHIVPWRAGGAWYEMGNLRASCAHCNTARAWREEVRRPSREW